MIIVKTQELSDVDLDLWVAKALGLKVRSVNHSGVTLDRPIRDDVLTFRPSSVWADGGELIDEEGIALVPPGVYGRHVDGEFSREWCALIDPYDNHDGLHGRYISYGASALEAAMRAVLLKKFGDVVYARELDT